MANVFNKSKEPWKQFKFNIELKFSFQLIFKDSMQWCKEYYLVKLTILMNKQVFLVMSPFVNDLYILYAFKKAPKEPWLKKYGIMVERFNYQNTLWSCKNILICLRHFQCNKFSWYLIKIHGKNISFLAMLSHLFCSDLIIVVLYATIIKYFGSRRNNSWIALED